MRSPSSDPNTDSWLKSFVNKSVSQELTLTLRLLMLYIYMERLFLMFLDHTQRRSTVGRTPLDEWSARRRDLYLTTRDTHNRQISMPPVGFEPKISAGERPCRSPAEIVGSNPTGGHGYLSVVSVVCCQVEVSATSWSLVQRSPTTVLRRCVWSRNIKNRCSIHIYDISNLRFNLHFRRVAYPLRCAGQCTAVKE